MARPGSLDLKNKNKKSNGKVKVEKCSNWKVNKQKLNNKNVGNMSKMVKTKKQLEQVKKEVSKMLETCQTNTTFENTSRSQ